jgi:hypothetical protein
VGFGKGDITMTRKQTSKQLVSGMAVLAFLAVPWQSALAESRERPSTGPTKEEHQAFAAHKIEMVAPDLDHPRFGSAPDAEPTAVVPEPGTMALLGLGLAALGAARRRAARRQAA